MPTIGKVEGKQGSTAARRRDKASDALGIARHTAKFHLDKLAEEGLLDISFKRILPSMPRSRASHQAVRPIQPTAIGDLG